MRIANGGMGFGDFANEMSDRFSNDSWATLAASHQSRALAVEAINGR